jgi:NADP-dependent 3-hydroxy acid dehydrogenase YdfG
MTGRIEPGSRTALVTGASSGIGERIALDLATLGYRVVAVARRDARLESLAEAARSKGAEIIPVRTDVTDAAQAKHAVDETMNHTGRLDVVVNNAGLGVIGPTLGSNLDDWQRMVQVNVVGVFNVTHACLPIMVEQQEGHLVAISSAAGRRVHDDNGVYSATKHAVGAFYESIRLELSSKGIRTTLIEPETVRGTEILEHIPHRRSRLALALSTANLAMEPEDVSAALIFAISQPRRVTIAEMLITN